jgi:hypothetical protein
LILRNTKRKLKKVNGTTEATRTDHNKRPKATAFDKVGMERLPGKSSVKYWGYKRIIVSVLKWGDVYSPIMKPNRKAITGGR